MTKNSAQGSITVRRMRPTVSIQVTGLSQTWKKNGSMGGYVGINVYDAGEKIPYGIGDASGFVVSGLGTAATDAGVKWSITHNVMGYTAGYTIKAADNNKAVNANLNFTLTHRSEVYYYTINITTVADGMDGKSIIMTETNLVWKHGESAMGIIGIDVYEGSKKIPYGGGRFSCSTLQPPENVGWRFVTQDSPNAKHSFEYWVYAKPQPWKGGDVSLPFTVTVDGVVQSYDIKITTIKDGDKGEQGIQGCIWRNSRWVEGVEYRNDSALDIPIRFIDIAVIDDVNPIKVYMCTRTHVSDSSTKPGTNGAPWAILNGMAPIYTPLIVAENAVMKFAQSNQLLITRTNDSGATEVYMGIGGPEYPFWAGGMTAESPSTNFRVDKNGCSYQRGAKIQGTIDCFGEDSRRVVIRDGGIRIFGNQSHANIVVGTDDDGCAILRFFDKEGKLVYDLGPNGINKISTSNARTELGYMRYHGKDLPEVKKSEYGNVEFNKKDIAYQYFAKIGVNGVDTATAKFNHTWTRSKPVVLDTSKFLPDGWYSYSTIDGLEPQVELSRDPNTLQYIVPSDVHESFRDATKSPRCCIKTIYFVKGGKITLKQRICFTAFDTSSLLPTRQDQ